MYVNVSVSKRSLAKFGFGLWQHIENIWENADNDSRKWWKINLTHSDHFISDVDKGFINAHIKQTLKLNTNTEWKSQVYDYGNILKIFNGLKDSNQVFDRLEILHNNVNVGYQQNEMIREGFLYGVQKPEAEKKRFTRYGKT